MILQVLCLAMLAVASESVSLAAVEHVPLAEVWQIVPDFPETGEDIHVAIKKNL